ncbi:MAG: hypothetical protein LN546_04365 [Rickettsia endosymbiont of Ecitomorpha arachnoides]|nr:hypothetical protein [Rickettsia endosymbiont of Ecitomorpha arachnoides]
MPRGGFLGKVDKEFKKGRNDHDAQVEKCKKQIDRINNLNVNKIIYDRETAYVEVPRYDGLTENFKWAWLSGDRGKREKTIEEFKQILNILEAKNNPAQYNSLVSNLNASTKNALDVNIKKYNITVPTQQISQEELVEKALAEAKHSIKISDVTAEFKKYFSELDLDGVVLFINTAKQSGIDVDGCVGTALQYGIKYPAIWKGVLTKKFFIENSITNPYVSFDSKIEPNVQAELVEKALAEAERSTKANNVTAEFKDHFSKLDPDGVLAFMQCTKGTTINVDGCVGTALQDVVDIYPATWNGVSTKKFFVENGITNPYVSFDSKIEPSTQSEVQEEAYNSATASTADQGASFEEEDSDDDIEVISQLLESKVMLNNGTTIEVKAILKDLSDKEFINMVLKRVNPDIAELVEKEIVLKLVYDVQKGLITKRDAGKIIYSFNDDFDLSDGWLANNNLSIDEIKAKEVEITGGASYLE